MPPPGGTRTPLSSVSQPKRIMSLSPSSTEDLFAIGAGPQVVAVDDQSNYPPNAPRTKLSGFSPNAEAIAAVHREAHGLLADEVIQVAQGA